LDIAFIIRDLLTRREGLVIPGLGSLIAEFRSASIAEDRKVIEPPRKIVRFDPGVTEDADEILAGEIAQRENTGIEEARQKIREYVDAVQGELNQHEKVEIKDFGTLKKDVEGVIQFEQSLKAEDNLGFEEISAEPFELEGGSGRPGKGKAREKDQRASGSGDSVFSREGSTGAGAGESGSTSSESKGTPSGPPGDQSASSAGSAPSAESTSSTGSTPSKESTRSGESSSSATGQPASAGSSTSRGATSGSSTSQARGSGSTSHKPPRSGPAGTGSTPPPPPPKKSSRKKAIWFTLLGIFLLLVGYAGWYTGFYDYLIHKWQQRQEETESQRAQNRQQNQKKAGAGGSPEKQKPQAKDKTGVSPNKQKEQAEARANASPEKQKTSQQKQKDAQMDRVIDKMTDKKRALMYEEKKDTSTYYLVAGSFKRHENAREFRRQLKDQGYPAQILHRDNLYRVTVKTYDKKQQALVKLYQMRDTGKLESIWLLSVPEKDR